MKKERFLELTKIGIEVMELLDKRKVTHQERCAVNSICNNISNYDYGNDGSQPELTELSTVVGC